MAIDFNADEIFQIAEEIERNGAAFYRKAAEMFEQEGPKVTFLELADWEEEHLRTFTSMHSEITAEEAKPTTYDPEGQAEMYLQAFADGHVFDTKVKPADRLAGGESVPDILRMAIGLEKDSVAFYTGLKELVPARLGKDKIEKIITEEMSHITKLSRELAHTV